jgi:hypothetical protein
MRFCSILAILWVMPCFAQDSAGPCTKELAALNAAQTTEHQNAYVACLAAAGKLSALPAQPQSAAPAKPKSNFRYDPPLGEMRTYKSTDF